ncbi:hypothetical protein [Aeromonas enteropelogenes]|uniref:hypothetical protein n=1 Tax=Aeromonas enteropelogenes TaxID=29489 RepID=UPI003B9E0F8E
MICAVSKSSILELMLDPDINKTTSAFKFSFSSHLIKHIESYFKDEPAKLDLFKQWLSSRGVFSNRIRYIPDDDVLRYFDINDINQIHASCAYFSGHFIFDESTTKDQIYIDYGIDINSIKNFHNYFGQGDNPIFEKTLIDNGNETPISLCKFFRKEKEVYFIDNHLNLKSLDFIKEVVQELHETATVYIITRRSALSELGDAINSILENKPNLILKPCYLKKEGEFHDRHIFVGQRIHIRATSGLDAFSFRGKWCNREGTFSVYDVHEKAHIKKFEVIKTNGLPKTIHVRQMKA